MWGGAYQRDAIVPLMTQLLKSCSGTSATVVEPLAISHWV